MKKLLSVLLAAIILIGLTACGKSAPPVDGQELIKTAQEAYTALDSARLVITDMDTGEVEQQFTFRYEDDVLHYLYESTYEGSAYYERNNGKDVQIQKSGEVKAYKWPSKNFKKYKRSKTHPNADTGIFFFEPECISDAQVEKAEDNTVVSYSYDIEKLSKKMATETTEGKMTAFETTFNFDKDGNFVNLLETSVFDKDGKKASHTYSIEIKDRNKELLTDILQ